MTDDADYLCFLKIDGIDGDSRHHAHKGEIDVLSFTLGSSQNVSMEGHGLGAGRPEITDISFSAQMSKASPKLALACASGQRFPQAVLSCRRGTHPTPVENLVIRLVGVRISSYATGGSPMGMPLEQFSLDFDQIAVEYRPLKHDRTPDAPLKMGWDVNKSCAI